MKEVEFFFRLVHHWIFQFEELLGQWGGVILFVIVKLEHI